MGSEAAHTGPRGLGQKSPDEQCIPLCPDHHRHRRDALDVAGPKNFQAIHRIDIQHLVQRLQSNWTALQTGLILSAEKTSVAKTEKLVYV